MRLKYSVLLLLAFFACPSWAATYYVNASSGNNSNPGTALFPWKSLTYAATTGAGANTISVAPGSYTAGGTGEKFPILIGSGMTFTSPLAGQATIDAGADANDVVSMESDSTLDGFRVVTYATTGSPSLVRIYGDRVHLSNNLLDNYRAAAYGIYCSGDGLTAEGTAIRADRGAFISGDGPDLHHDRIIAVNPAADYGI